MKSNLTKVNWILVQLSALLSCFSAWLTSLWPMRGSSKPEVDVATPSDICIDLKVANICINCEAIYLVNRHGRCPRCGSEVSSPLRLWFKGRIERSYRERIKGVA